MKNTAVILVNIGSPESLRLKDIRRFLQKFLGDGRVIAIPAFFRKILVNGIIVPFRLRKSAGIYKQSWTENGSELIHLSQKFADKLQEKLGSRFDVFPAMRYSKPSLSKLIEHVWQAKYRKIIVVPMFPQYASATTGSVMEFFFNKTKNKNFFPELRFVSYFYDRPDFIKAFAEKIKKHKIENYEHFLFSYHGLPLKQVYEIHANKSCDDYNCVNEINSENKFCYQAQCYATSRLLASEINIDKNRYTVCFQSRFAKRWLSPFTDEVIEHLAKDGVKRILVISPSFIVDCIETSIEIGIEYKELFIKHGGDSLQLVESLNESELWINALENLIRTC